jgi:hypothetical protein
MNAIVVLSPGLPALFLPATLLLTGLGAWWISVRMLRLGKGGIDPKPRRRERRERDKS